MALAVRSSGSTRLARARAWLGTSEGKSVAALLIAAAIFRVLFVHLMQVAPDLQQYEKWGEGFLRDPLHAYSWVVRQGDLWWYPAYPPLMMYIMAVVDAVYFGTAHLLGLHASHSAFSLTFRTLLITPGILVDLAQVSMIYALARTRLRQQSALLIAATYAFSPAVFIDSAGWGQSDNLALLISAGFLLLALQRRGVWSGFLIGLAILLKPEPWILIPLALLYLYRWAGLQQALRAIAAMSVTVLAGWAPFLLPPNPQILVWRFAAYKVVEASGGVATRNGYNLWWLLGAQHVNVNSPYLGPLSPQIISGALFGLVLLTALAGVWFDSSAARLWAAAALISIAFFDVGTLQYERYIFPAVGLFLLAALYDRRYWWLYALVSVTTVLSLLPSALIFGRGPLVHIHGAARLSLMLNSSTVLLGVSLLNVALLVAAMALYTDPALFRPARAKSRPAVALQ